MPARKVGTRTVRETKKDVTEHSVTFPEENDLAERFICRTYRSRFNGSPSWKLGAMPVLVYVYGCTTADLQEVHQSLENRCRELFDFGLAPVIQIIME